MRHKHCEMQQVLASDTSYTDRWHAGFAPICHLGNALQNQLKQPRHAFEVSTLTATRYRTLCPIKDIAEGQPKGPSTPLPACCFIFTCISARTAEQDSSSLGCPCSCLQHALQACNVIVTNVASPHKY